ncbi:flagellar basal body P-ring formation chaperone FlgA [Azovibrio restrictus]|uniref:flagellar basal body P-ring formation chaperone FlgA n=1 Tax=Azovibrio restrictus TaxID=146938 RepID=UPI0026EEB421|nr:flagellar basal body P-ring formation chaperone FlgA [Azovibrio restrictus]
MKRFSAFLLGCISLAALAAPPQTNDHGPLLRLVEDYVRGQLQGQSGLVTVQAGPLDPRLRLPACHAFQPYTPTGARLLGKTSVGLRCTSPGRWNIFVPVRIAVETTYVATAAPLAPGQTLQATDLVQLSGDLGSLPAGVVTDPAAAVGKSVRFSVAAGQPLRQDQLVSPPVVQQGQSVKLVFHGPGFTASNEGRALNGGSEGQIIQVRTSSGIVVSGVAQSNGTVLVSPAQP